MLHNLERRSNLKPEEEDCNDSILNCMHDQIKGGEKKLISPIDNVKGLKKLEEKYWRPAEEKDKHDHRQHWHHLLYCIAWY